MRKIIKFSCRINSIRFFEEKRHVFLPRKNICVTFLTPFLLLHGNFVGMKCSKLSDEISSKVFLVFCVCLLFVDDFFALFYFISCHNMLLLKAIQSNWAKILQKQQALFLLTNSLFIAWNWVWLLSLHRLIYVYILFEKRRGFWRRHYFSHFIYFNICKNP